MEKKEVILTYLIREVRVCPMKELVGEKIPSSQIAAERPITAPFWGIDGEWQHGWRAVCVL